MLRTVLLSGFLLSAAVTITLAQEQSATGSRSFWITEVGYSRRFNCSTKSYSTEFGRGDDRRMYLKQHTPEKHHFNWELGRMSYYNQRSALGISTFLSIDTDGLTRFGVRPRYRRRLDDKTNLDIAPGVLLKGSAPMVKQFPGISTYLGLNFEEVIIVYGQMDIHRLEQFGTDIVWFGGIKLGSRPGLIVGAGSALICGLIKAFSAYDEAMDSGL